MIPTIQSTPLSSDGGVTLASIHDRGVAIDPSLRPAFAAHGDAEANLDRLFAPGSLCVTTGQQPGLFTGPLMTIYKAMSAVAVARRCEERLQRPVIPVFWVAGDDHDLAEANHAYLLGTTNQLEQIALRSRTPDEPTLPLYREPLGSELSEAIQRFSEITPDTEFRASQLEWVTRHYQSDADYAGAFTGAMAELLGRFGLVVFQPYHLDAKRLTAPYLIESLAHAKEVNEAVMATANAMATAGRTVPVPTHPGQTLVMVEGQLGRDRLRMNDSGFETRRSGEGWTLEALRELAHRDPQRLSPNVLLRPVVEAALLPTLTYVAGPGEKAYFPQTEHVYEILGVQRQGVVTRWSGRVVEARIEKTVQKYGFDANDLVGEEGQLEARLARGRMPDPAADALSVLRHTVKEQYPKLVEAAIEIDPTLRKPVQTAQSAAFTGIADVEKKLLSYLKKQDDVMLRQIGNARTALYPQRKPQERVFNVLQFLVRYGPDFLDGVHAACNAWANDLD
jgi:bacillithiol biosynthesis cysteine-adding enzyme BshC